MSPYQRHTAYAKMTALLERRSISWSFWKGGYLRTIISQALLSPNGPRCEISSYTSKYNTEFYVFLWIIPKTLNIGFRWHDAIRTLAKLHRIDPASIGLSSFGKPTGFYNRQIATLRNLEESQATAVDLQTKRPVGRVPGIEEALQSFSKTKYQPSDKGTIIHGDFKIDNLVFHKTEPRVIGILEYGRFYPDTAL